MDGGAGGLPRQRYRILDVYTSREGYRRLKTLYYSILVCLFVAVMTALYELFLLNNEDRDARDILNAYKQTLPGIQGHHSLFQLATQPLDLDICDISAAAVLSLQGPVAVFYFGLNGCQQTVSLPCLSSASNAPSPKDAEYLYASFEDWVAGLPSSAALVLPLLANGADQWSTDRLVAEVGARWDELAARSCSRRVDICQQVEDLLPDAIAAAMGTLPLCRLFDPSGRVPRVVILRDGTETGLAFDPRARDSPVFTRAELLAFFTDAARQLAARPAGYAGPPQPINDTTVDGELLLLTEEVEVQSSDIDVKAAAFMPALYFLKSTCPDTAYSKMYMEGQLLVHFEGYPFPPDASASEDGSAGPQNSLEVTFWDQTRQIPVYQVVENYDLQKLNVSKLLTVTITVGLVSLGPSVFNGTGYWELLSIEGEYDTPVEVDAVPLQDGSLAAVPALVFESSFNTVLVQVRDVSEPDTPALAEFRGSWRQIVMVGAGGLGGGMAGLIPFLSFIIWRNVMINNGNKMFQFVFFTNTINAIRRFFYFQSRQHRGW